MPTIGCRSYVLTNDQYEEVTHSFAFPLLTGAMATQLLAESVGTASTAWLRRVRQWVRESSKSEK